MSCTGFSAFWCPVCGDCSCERAHDGDCAFDNVSCPLHGRRTQHAATVQLGVLESQLSSIATDAGVNLSDADRAELSRFAQLLYDKSTKSKVDPS